MSWSPLAIRYALIAIFCFTASNTIVILGDHLSLPMPLSVTGAFAAVVALGYLLHCRCTFLAAPGWLGFTRYLAAMAANLPLSILWLWLFADAFGWPMALAAPLSSAIMAVINFLASRWAILGAGRAAFVAENS